MKSLYIICEGQSEHIFVDKLLIPYLYSKHMDNFSGYRISAPILRSPKANNQANKGGNVSYIRLKNHIENLIKQTSDCYITTFIDFYGIGNDFPCYNQLGTISDIYQKIAQLETDLQLIHASIIPYVQLHEYETIYFADIGGFVNSDYNLTTINQDLINICMSFNNCPENINNSSATAPSKRIERLIAQKLQLKYKKTFYASLYVSDNNYMNKIELIRVACPHFDNWINKLLALV